MKNINPFFAVILLLSFTRSVAQTISCNSFINPLLCNSDPAVPKIADENVAVEHDVKYAQKNKIYDISYFNSSDQVLSDCGDTEPYSCTLDMNDMLTYDVYYPPANIYPCYNKNPLPAIILFHGGGFSDCSSADGTGGIVQYCMEFAKRGFVAFNVKYRTGRIKDPQTVPGEQGNYMSASNLLAIYRAYQDARGAVRSIIARQLGTAPPPYKIDLNNIYTGGVSAGGFVALSLAYYTPDMLYEVFGDVSAKLGSLNENLYKGSPDINFKIKGVLNLWGGAYIPAAYASSAADFFAKNTDKKGNNANPPLIAFHGMQDFTVPLKKAGVFYSVSPAFTKAKFCSPIGDGIFTLPNNDIDKPMKDLLMYGSQSFYDMLAGDLRVPAEIYLDSDMQHGLSEKSDFGTNAKVKQDKTLIIPYIVQRAMAFFQSVVNGFDTKLVDTKFVDCENFRTGCSPNNNHEACTSSSVISSGSENNDLHSANLVEKIFTVSQVNRNIYIKLNKEGKSNILFTDMYGNPVKNQFANYSRQLVINAQNLAAGIYTLKVNLDGINQSVKISLF